MTSPDLDAILAGYLEGDDPVPEEAECFVGDGDYRAIGAEFLGHFVRLGSLLPDDRVFEIGCGMGRMAMPIRRYLSEKGRYHGMDVVKLGISHGPCLGVISVRWREFSLREAAFLPLSS
jgi:hypothetical protein